MRCTATANRTGEQCQRAAIEGGRVCPMHGGRAPAVKAAAARRVAEAKAQDALDRSGAGPVGNPLAALQQLAGEILVFKEWLAGRVEQLNEMRYRGASGEQIRGELQAYERALDRSARVLSDIARLNIDERLARITEQQVDDMGALVSYAIRLVFGDDGGAFLRVMGAILRHPKCADPHTDMRAALRTISPAEVPEAANEQVQALRRLIEDGHRAQRLDSELAEARVEIDRLRDLVTTADAGPRAIAPAQPSTPLPWEAS